MRYNRHMAVLAIPRRIRGSVTILIRHGDDMAKVRKRLMAMSGSRVRSAMNVMVNPWCDHEDVISPRGLLASIDYKTICAGSADCVCP